MALLLIAMAASKPDCKHFFFIIASVTAILLSSSSLKLTNSRQMGRSFSSAVLIMFDHLSIESKDSLESDAATIMHASLLLNFPPNLSSLWQVVMSRHLIVSPSISHFCLYLTFLSFLHWSIVSWNRSSQYFSMIEVLPTCELPTRWTLKPPTLFDTLAFFSN